MKTKLLLVLILVLMMLVQACAPSASATGSASPAGPTASANTCPTASADTKLLTNTKDGYCLLYPAEDSAALPGWVVINPNSNPGDTPGDAWVYIQAQDAAGRSVAD